MRGDDPECAFCVSVLELGRHYARSGFLLAFIHLIKLLFAHLGARVLLLPPKDRLCVWAILGVLQPNGRIGILGEIRHRWKSLAKHNDVFQGVVQDAHF